MSVLEHLSTVLAELVREDPRRVLLGEDVKQGGMLGLSRVAAEDEELAARLLSTPLTPSVAIAHAAGLSLAGSRPILVLDSGAGLIDGLAALRESGQLRWRSGDSLDVPLLIVAPTGPGFSLGGDAAGSPESLVAAIPGLRVIVGGQASELGGLLRSAASFDEDPSTPTVVLLPRRLLLADIDPGPRELPRPLGSACRRQNGDAATVFAWGGAVDQSLQAAQASGLSVSVVDVGSLAPLDTEALVAAAAETGKLVIAHAGPAENGLGAQLAALFADQAILHLDAPVVRVCGRSQRPTPYDEHTAMPSVEAISQAIADVAHY